MEIEWGFQIKDDLAKGQYDCDSNSPCWSTKDRPHLGILPREEEPKWYGFIQR